MNEETNNASIENDMPITPLAPAETSAPVEEIVEAPVEPFEAEAAPIAEEAPIAPIAPAQIDVQPIPNY